MRLCVVTRERLPRSLMFRVVRSGVPPRIVVGAGEGRSAYVSKSVAAVHDARRMNKIGRSLRTRVPPEILDELEELAAAFADVDDSEKGMLFCDVYGVDAVLSTVDAVQMPLGEQRDCCHEEHYVV